jgi:hypothetical protein
MKRFSPAHACLVAGILYPALSLAQTHRAPHPSDAQILSKVQSVFHDDHAFSGSSIIPSVSNGVVTLTGTVRSEAEKSLASADLLQIMGIKTVLNNLDIHDNTFHAPAPVAKVPTGPTGPQLVTLPVGTTLAVRLSEEIDTKTAKANDSFHGTLASPVNQNGFVLLQAGTPVTGRVVDAKAASHFSGSAGLTIELTAVRVQNGDAGQDLALTTQPVSSKANGRGANTAEKAGGGAAAGALLGALAGGGAGAAIGATGGGALGLGANAITRGKEIDLKPEQLLQFHTLSPVQLTVMLVDGKQIIQKPAAPVNLQARPAGAQ